MARKENWYLPLQCFAAWISLRKSAVNISKTFTSSYFDLVLGGEIGKSYGLEDSFQYIQLYTRVETIINDKAHVYVQFNWLDNDDVVYDSTTFASSENFDSSIQAGVSFNF